MGNASEFDLPAYLGRIGAGAVPSPDLPALETLHARHLSTIPFENIDVYLGRPGGLGLEALQSKLVRAGRGGYCFEQNTLFAAALRALGYRVRTLEARVRPPGVTAVMPRTHMVLEVEIDGRAFAADVGFGGDGPIVPIALDGTPSEQPIGIYRVDREEGGIHVMRLSRDGVWRDLYAFTLTSAEAVDYEVAHHFTSTHPRSPFVRTLTAQRSEPETRHILRDRSYTVRTRGGETARVIEDGQLGALLAETFGLRVGDDLLGGILEKLNRPKAE
ncbi:MAG TPA: arylamine N-acetyltransferase [Candidatus Saccharimonadales bacterium]|nr:arylamine N-acetyltransferase [Candidatus Saccharimonadales bacterium]